MKLVVKETDLEILELIDLMGMLTQTNHDKYEILSPIFERLNLYCDEASLRLEKDADLFAIPLSAIYSVEYEEDGDVLYLLFKNNKRLHSIVISQKIHIIYITKEKRNSVIRLFQKVYNRIRITLICFGLINKLIKHIMK